MPRHEPESDLGYGPRTVETDFTTDTGDSSDYEGVSLFTPAGVPSAIVSANFRPFPWEAGASVPRLAHRAPEHANDRERV